jgi:hypothetical protein
MGLGVHNPTTRKYVTCPMVGTGGVAWNKTFESSGDTRNMFKGVSNIAKVMSRLTSVDGGFDPHALPKVVIGKESKRSVGRRKTNRGILGKPSARYRTGLWPP